MNTTFLKSVLPGATHGANSAVQDLQRTAAQKTGTVSQGGSPVVGVANTQSADELAVANANAVEAAAKDREAKRQDAEVSAQVLGDSIKRLNEYMQASRRELQFIVDEDSGRQVVKVVDSDTAKVIRQFPSEEVVALSRALQQSTGLMFKDQV